MNLRNLKKQVENPRVISKNKNPRQSFLPGKSIVLKYKLKLFELLVEFAQSFLLCQLLR